VLTIVAGAWILIAPLTGAITLTVVLVAWVLGLGRDSAARNRGA
jgi:uncharacterized membrane protein HdeD (DUF308 family)